MFTHNHRLALAQVSPLDVTCTLALTSMRGSTSSYNKPRPVASYDCRKLALFICLACSLVAIHSNIIIILLCLGILKEEMDQTKAQSKTSSVELT